MGRWKDEVEALSAARGSTNASTVRVPLLGQRGDCRVPPGVATTGRCATRGRHRSGLGAFPVNGDRSVRAG
jgi:hypothetical protein